MGAVKENLEFLVGYKTQEEKNIELAELYDKIYYALLLEGMKNDFKINNPDELIDCLNRINLIEYLGLKEGYGYQCVRKECLSKMTNANFYKYNGIWMYKCFTCFDEKPVPQSKIILDVIKTQHPNHSHLDIVNMTREMLSVDYTDEYYDMVKDTITHNLEIIRNLDKKSSLYKLLTKRKLDIFFKDFTEMARVYSMKQQSNNNKIAFYASREFMKKYFEFVLGKKANNSILQKIDVLNALGFIRKVGADELDERMMEKVITYQAKMRMSANNKKNFLKQVNCFTIEKVSPEALEEAERVAKIIIDNKINILTQAHMELIKKPKQLNENDLVAVETISNVISSLMGNKLYITQKALQSELDFKITKEVLDKVLEGNNLMLAKGTVKNKNKYMVDDIDNVKLNDFIIVAKEKNELEKFLEQAGIDLVKHIELEGYALNRDLYKIICSNKKVYKEENGTKKLLTKKEKETLIKNQIGKIMIMNNLMSLKCKKENVEKYQVSETCKCQETMLVFK